MLLGAGDCAYALLRGNKISNFAKLFFFVGVYDRLKIGAAAGGKDGYALHFNVTPLPLTVLPSTTHCSPVASSWAIAFLTSCFLTQTTIPIPILKVL